MLALTSQARGRGFEPLSPDSKSGSLPLAHGNRTLVAIIKKGTGSLAKKGTTLGLKNASQSRRRWSVSGFTCFCR